MLGELIWEKLKLKTSDLRDSELEFDPTSFLQVLNSRLKLTIGFESFLSSQLRKKKKKAVTPIWFWGLLIVHQVSNQLEIWLLKELPTLKIHT